MTNEKLGEEITRIAALLHQEAITTPPAKDSTAYHALRESTQTAINYMESADAIRAVLNITPKDYEPGPLDR